MQNFIVMVKCRIELYSMHFQGVENVLGVKIFCDCYKLHDIVITVTIDEIKVCDNRINIKGSIQLKVRNDLK